MLKRNIMVKLIAILASIFLLAISASMVQAQNAPVEKTGQTTVYATGDDGYYQKGVAWPNPRFIDNGDGTVTDNLTGLMWAENANLFGTKNWADAITACESLILGQKACGNHNDWRLPNRYELESLLDMSNSNPALPSGHPFINVQTTHYWASTTRANNVGSIDYAWAVFMNDGNSAPLGGNYGHKQLKSYYVWAVRGDSTVQANAPVQKTGQTTVYATGDDGYYQKGVAWPNPRFTDHGDETITDNLTGLMWTQKANFFEELRNWANALTVCENLSLGNDGYGGTHTDWRMPNRYELKSLLDMENSHTPLPSGHPFHTVSGYYYWTSTSVAYDTSLAWVIDFGYGLVSHDTKQYLYYVWPVRGGQ